MCWCLNLDLAWSCASLIQSLWISWKSYGWKPQRLGERCVLTEVEKILYSRCGTKGLWRTSLFSFHLKFLDASLLSNILQILQIFFVYLSIFLCTSKSNEIYIFYNFSLCNYAQMVLFFCIVQFLNFHFLILWWMDCRNGFIKIRVLFCTKLSSHYFFRSI